MSNTDDAAAARFASNNSEIPTSEANNKGPTQRQMQSAFRPTNPHPQQQLAEQFQQAVYVTPQQQQAFYSGQAAQQSIPPLPLGVDVPLAAHYGVSPSDLHPSGMIYPGFVPTMQQYHSHLSNVPVSLNGPQQVFDGSPNVYPPMTSSQPIKPTVAMRPDAALFLPSSAAIGKKPLTEESSSNEKSPTDNGSTPATDDPEHKETPTNEISSKPSLIFDLKKYKHDYFISELYCDFDRDHGKFGSPTGICTLTDDRLLVANFDRDSLLMIDIAGVVHQIYKDLSSPKDILYDATSSPHAIVALRKELIMLDLNTSKVIVRSKARGFYPWNIQHIKENNVYAACDPSGERIVFFDATNLTEIGDWSLTDPSQEHLRQTQPQHYQKVYPYAAYFMPDNTSYVLIHRQDKCRLSQYDTVSSSLKSVYDIPQPLNSFSILIDDNRKCLLADKPNRRLVSIDKDYHIEEYRCKSIQEPYSMTFLSTGTLCVTDWNKSHRTSGGIAILSEVNLKQQQQ